MLAQRPTSVEHHRAFGKAMSDAVIAPAVVEFLEKRVEDLDRLGIQAARAALLNPDARNGALILEGQLREAKSWLDTVKRYLETDGKTKGAAR